MPTYPTDDEWEEILKGDELIARLLNTNAELREENARLKEEVAKAMAMVAKAEADLAATKYSIPDGTDRFLLIEVDTEED